MRRGGADPLVLEKFYCVVVQAVLLLGSETWVMSSTMSKTFEGVHVGLLQWVTGKKARMEKDVSWRKSTLDSVLQEVGTQPLQT